MRRETWYATIRTWRIGRRVCLRWGINKNGPSPAQFTFRVRVGRHTIEAASSHSLDFE